LFKIGNTALNLSLQSFFQLIYLSAPRIKQRTSAEIELNLVVSLSAVRANNIKAEYYSKKMEAAGLGKSFFAAALPPSLDNWKPPKSPNDDRNTKLFAYKICCLAIFKGKGTIY